MSTPSEGPVDMDLPTNHLSSAAARAWRPDKPATQLSHLMSCPTCRDAVGRGLLFRGLISLPTSKITHQHLSPAEIDRFHEFVFLAAPEKLVSSIDFLRMFEHLSTCNDCLSALLQAQKASKPSKDEISKLIRHIQEDSYKVNPPSKGLNLNNPELVGRVDIMLLPRGIRVEFIPHPSTSSRVKFSRPTTRSPNILLAKLGSQRKTELRGVSLYSKKNQFPDEKGAVVDYPFDPMGQDSDGINLQLENRSITLNFSRYASGTRISAKVLEKYSKSPVSGFRISCQAENPRLSAEDSWSVAATDEVGRAVLNAPDLVVSESSTSSRLSTQGWRLRLEDTSVNEIFELTLKLRRSGKR